MVKTLNWNRKAVKGTKRPNIVQARRLKVGDNKIKYYGVKSINDKKLLENFLKSKTGQAFMNKKTTKKAGRPKTTTKKTTTTRKRNKDGSLRKVRKDKGVKRGPRK